MRETKRALRRRIEVQKDMIETLEEQVLIMGDVAKIKDLTIQALVGAMGTQVEPNDVKAVLDRKSDPGQYL